MSRVKKSQKILYKGQVTASDKEIARFMCLLGSIDYCYMSTFKLNNQTYNIASTHIYTTWRILRFKVMLIVIGHWQPNFLLLHLKEHEKISRLAV